MNQCHAECRRSFRPRQVTPSTRSHLVNKTILLAIITQLFSKLCIFCSSREQAETKILKRNCKGRNLVKRVFFYKSLNLTKFKKMAVIYLVVLSMTQFLTMMSLCGHPTFCIPAGRQKDGHFLSWMRDSITVKRSFVCGLIDIWVQKAISWLIND